MLIFFRSSVTCGSIYCKPLDSKITKRPGVTIWPRSPFCYTSYPGDITTIPLVELVPDGAQCGLDKVRAHIFRRYTSLY